MPEAEMPDYDYDLFVIGAGSGGVRAARMAAQYGARVAVAEEYRFGGTCVVRGCVPKKLLVYAGRFADEFDEAAGYGWTVPEPSFDWATLIASKDDEIARLEGLYVKTLENAGAELFASRAEIAGPNRVRLLADDREVTARTILVATGARPRLLPGLPGIEHVITSNEAFHLDELPRRVVVVGGGYIALEFASIFAALGSATTLLYRGAEVLRGFDNDVRTTVHEGLAARGIDVVCGEVFERIERGGGGLVGHTSGGLALEADTIMFAIGRDPNTENLGLDRAGVELAEGGAIRVDEYSRTTAAGIYAVGDVTDRMALTPVAIREGAAFAETVFNDNPTAVDLRHVPTCVFTTPEVGTVGMTEEHACAELDVVEVYRTSFRPMKLSLTENRQRMMMKLVVDGVSGRVVGCHIVGPDAGEMIQLVGVAVRMGATKADFDATVAVHPTAAEELVTMRTPSARHVRRAPAKV